MGAKKNVDMTATTDTVKIVTTVEEPVEADAKAETDAATETAEAEQTTSTKKKAAKSGRSLKYRAARARVDKTKLYAPPEALELVKSLSYSSFEGTITADVVVKEVGVAGSVTLPHAAGKTKKVAIVTDELLKDIEAGKLDFDALVSSPEFMPKLAKFARVLGPKGLMPSPKTGTLTPNPEAKKKELEAGQMTLRTDKKQPLLHVTIGKISSPTEQLVENLEALVKALGSNVRKVAVSATMSPGVRVDFSKLV